MENEIKRGDYIELTNVLDGAYPTIIGKLYNQHDYHSCITTNFTCGLEDLIKYSQICQKENLL